MLPTSGHARSSCLPTVILWLTLVVQHGVECPANAPCSAAATDCASQAFWLYAVTQHQMCVKAKACSQNATACLHTETVKHVQVVENVLSVHRFGFWVAASDNCHTWMHAMQASQVTVQSCVAFYQLFISFSLMLNANMPCAQIHTGYESQGEC